jgi:aquaporin Z
MEQSSHDAPSPNATPHHDRLTAKEAWSRHETGPSMTARLVAETIGTFLLMVGGLSAGLLGLPFNGGLTLIVGIGWAVTVIVVIIAVGHISGAHINPAVSVGLWSAGRFPGRDIVPYVLAQVAGAVAGAGFVRLLVGLSPTSDNGAAAMSDMSIGWGDHSRWGVSLPVGLAAELLLTAALLATILSATSVRAPHGQSPYTIGLALMLLVVIGIPLTNAGLNPARATGAAVWAEPWALHQLWAWWLAPLAGAFVVGLLYRLFGDPEDLETVQLVDAVTDEA